MAATMESFKKRVKPQIIAKGSWKPFGFEEATIGLKGNVNDLICFEELVDYELSGQSSEPIKKSKKVVKGNKAKNDTKKEEKDKQSTDKKKKKRKLPPNTQEEPNRVKKKKKEPVKKPKQPSKEPIKKSKKSAKEPVKKSEKTAVDEKTDEGAKKDIDVSEWLNLYVPDPIMKALKDLGFARPTPIQLLCLPPAIRDGMDIVGAAETGSGKTLAFGIPILNHILQLKNQPESENEEGEEEEHDITELEKEKTRESSSIDEHDKERDEKENGEEDAEEEDGEFEEELSEEIMESDETSSDEDDGELEYDEIFNYEEEDAPTINDTSDNEDDGDGTDSDIETVEYQGNPSKIGCVKVIDNVKFDWLPQASPLHAASKKRGLLALVLTPTRELAIQVKNHLQALAKHTDIKVSVVVGGMASQKQERLLRKAPEIVVATPGRFWELYEQNEPHLMTLSGIRFLVVDEADRMVEKGHYEELTNVLEILQNSASRERRQTFIFSATLTFIHSGPDRILHGRKISLNKNQKIGKLLEEIGVRPKHKMVDLTKSAGLAQTLTEARINCSTTDKDIYLYYFLKRYPGRTLVFTNSIDCIRRLASIFTLLHCRPLPLHANMHQRQRLKNLERFAADPQGLLLATDVAARGLDIPNIQHVVHYQVARVTETYIHRSGRTARATKEGLSIMLVGPEDARCYQKIIKSLDREDDLPVVPVEMEYFREVMARVNAARHIDKLEHGVRKKQSRNNWFVRAAKDLDIDLEDEEHLDDLGDLAEQKERQKEVKHLKNELNSMLKKPVFPKGFSALYPTAKFGRLPIGGIHAPITNATKSLKAVEEVKKEKIEKKNLESILINKTLNKNLALKTKVTNSKIGVKPIVKRSKHRARQQKQQQKTQLKKKAALRKARSGKRSRNEILKAKKLLKN